MKNRVMIAGGVVLSAVLLIAIVAVMSPPGKEDTNVGLKPKVIETGESGDRADELTYVADGWQRIKAVEPEVDIRGMSQPTIEDAADYWYPIYERCDAEFQVMLTTARENGELETFARQYVGYFGQDGPEADMRWALSCTWISDCDETVPPSIQDGVRPFSEAIVQSCLESPDIYRRWYWFHLATHPAYYVNSDRPRVGFTVMDIEDGLKLTQDDAEFWYAVRSFLVVAYLCDWAGNFSDFDGTVTPEYFREKFPRFKEYFLAKAGSMVFDQEAYHFRENGIGAMNPLAWNQDLPTFEAPPYVLPDGEKLPYFPCRGRPNLWQELWE